MNVIVFLAFLAPIMAFEVEINRTPMNHLQTMQVRIMEKKIIEVLECIRDILKNGDADLGVPVLDPLNIAEVGIDLSALNLQGISGHAKIADLNAAGIASWDLDKLKIGIIAIPVGAKVAVKVTWPEGLLSGSYDVNASIFDHTIQGAGSGSKLRFGDLAIELTTKVGITPIAIKDVDLKVSLDTAKLKFDELRIDGVNVATLLSEFVNNLPGMLEESADALDNIIDTIVVPLLNKILEAVLSGEKFMGVNMSLLGKCWKPS